MTNNFEGGVLEKYPLCDSCDLTTIPLRFTTLPPIDFGWNLFQYEGRVDTVFYGTTVWDGSGNRIIPRYLVGADSFKIISREIPPPLTKHYYFSLPHLVDEWIQVKADQHGSPLRGSTLLKLSRSDLIVLDFFFTHEVLVCLIHTKPIG